MNMADYEVRIVGPRTSTDNPVAYKIVVRESMTGMNKWSSYIVSTNGELNNVDLDVEKEDAVEAALEKGRELGLETHIHHEDGSVEIVSPPCSNSVL